MIAVKSMDVRDNFKTWCREVEAGEVVRISRPGNSCVYMINQETYEKTETERRMRTYASYMYGKDKIVNLKRLSEIEKLPDDWNNNGADKISGNIIRAVRKLIVGMDEQPEIFPTACDALQLEWSNSKNEYLEMEVLEDSINVFLIDSEGNEQQKVIAFEESAIKEMVRGFYE